MGDEVILEGCKRGGERAAVPEGPEAHVDAERLPLGRDLGEERDQLLARGREELVVRRAQRPRGLAVGAVEEHEVHIGGDVQLLAAQLAERGDGQARASSGLAVHACGGALRFGSGGGDALVGEAGHGGEHLVEAGEAIQVAMGERDHHALAQLPQARAETFRVAREKGAHFIARERAGLAPRQFLHDARARRGDAGDIQGEPEGAFESGAKRLRGGAKRH